VITRVEIGPIEMLSAYEVVIAFGVSGSLAAER
jgi:hypothetical protein